VAGEDPSPLERLLAERVALCWVAASYADAEYARKLKGGMSFREREYLARRREQTNRQLLKAVESLVRVRRLLTPMQINIGQNQINLIKQARMLGGRPWQPRHGANALRARDYRY
jgi:hypothetical protein